jgi:hypothetical protein
MPNSVDSSTSIVAPSTRTRFAGPIWTLILLAPFIAEVLSGSTRLNVLFVYIPEVMVWGVGALFCRELARRWRAGGTSLLLLGLALSIAEEFLIQQTSIAPVPFPGSHADYGRVWGVNLVYLLFMLGFESVWVVVVPVQVTELMFAKRGREPWLRTRGIIVCCVVSLLGCRGAWYGWTQQARPRLGAPAYHPPAALLAVGIASILALVGLAYLLRGFGKVDEGDRRRAAPPWVAGVTAFVTGLGWFFIITQIFVPKPVQPYWLVLLMGIGWALVTFALFTAWASRGEWSTMHRYSAAFGATLGCMAAPYLSVASWSKPDLIALIVFHLFALAGFTLLGRKVLRHETARELDSVLS